MPNRERRPDLDVVHGRYLAQSLHDGIVVHHDRRIVVVDFGDGLVNDGWQAETAALPIARQILAAGLN